MIRSYDPAVLGKFAERLLAQADRIVVICVVLGLLLGAFAFFTLRLASPSIGVFAAILCVGIAAYIGIELAFKYRVQAHTVLCQVAIEANTRQVAITTQLGQVQTVPRPGV